MNVLYNRSSEKKIQGIISILFFIYFKSLRISRQEFFMRATMETERITDGPSSSGAKLSGQRGFLDSYPILTSVIFSMLFLFVGIAIGIPVGVEIEKNGDSDSSTSAPAWVADTAESPPDYWVKGTGLAITFSYNIEEGGQSAPLADPPISGTNDLRNQYDWGAREGY